MHRTNIYLEERQVIELDRRARERGVSRADLIRSLIDEALVGGDSNLEADLAAIDAAFASEPDLEMPDRSDGERTTYIDSIWGADVPGRH